MKFEKLDICISDADILVKLCLTGHLGILGKVFKQVIIVKTVEEEAKRKLGRKIKGISISEAQSQGWLKIISVNDSNILEKEQIMNIEVFKRSYDCYLHPGELESAALANELGINLFLCDDRDAKKIIERETDKRGLAHWEVLTIGIMMKVISFEEAEKIFNDINSTRTHPIKYSFRELYKKAIKRIKDLKLFM